GSPPVGAHARAANFAVPLGSPARAHSRVLITVSCLLVRAHFCDDRGTAQPNERSAITEGLRTCASSDRPGPTRVHRFRKRVPRRKHTNGDMCATHREGASCILQEGIPPCEAMWSIPQVASGEGTARACRLLWACGDRSASVAHRPVQPQVHLLHAPRRPGVATQTRAPR